MGFRCVAPGNRSFNWETIKIARNILAVVRRGLSGGNNPTPAPKCSRHLGPMCRSGRFPNRGLPELPGLIGGKETQGKATCG